MQYTNFTIKKFKGIDNLSLDLGSNGAGIATLVGLNESGKTTILEAINFFQKDTPVVERHTLIPKSKKSNFNEKISVQATLLLDKNDEKVIRDFAKTLDFSINVDVKEIKIKKAYIYSRSDYKDSENRWTISLVGKKPRAKKNIELDAKSDVWQKIVSFIKKELLPPIIYYPNFLFDLPSRIQISPPPPETDKEQSVFYQILQDVLNAAGNGENIEDHLVKRMQDDSAQSQEALEATINKMSAKMTEVVFRAWENLMESRGKEIVIKQYKDPASTKLFIDMKLKEGSDTFLISERSLGFKWFFSFLLFTEFRKNRSADSGQILFLLDEPASNLHSTAQKKLLATFEKLAEKCRLVYTTHSHHLINPKRLEWAYIVRNKARKQNDEMTFDMVNTDIEAIPYRQFVSQHPNQTEYFQPILDTLEYQPGLLERVPDLVIIEGKNDFYVFKYINDIILGKKYDLNFYPGGGAGKNSDLVSLYIAWGREFTVLMDSDSAGEKAKKEYSDNFGRIVENKIFTYLDIESSWKNFKVENLFEEEERDAILKMFFPKSSAFSKKNFHLAMQNLLVDDTVVDLSDETKERFEKIFEFLK